MLFEGALTTGRTYADPDAVRATLFDRERRAGESGIADLLRNPQRYLECLFFAENLGDLEDALDLYQPQSARRLAISAAVPADASDDLPVLDLAYRFDLPLVDATLSSEAINALAARMNASFAEGVAVYWRCPDDRDGVPIETWQHRLLSAKS